MSEIHRSRFRIAGRKYSPEEYPAAIHEEAILGRVKLGITAYEKIGEALGKSGDQIQRIAQKMAAKGRVTLTKTGRIAKSEEPKVLLEYIEYKTTESLQSFIDSYPSVQKWVDDLKIRNSDGTPIVHYQKLVSHVRTVCDTLKTSPEAFLVSKETAQQFYTAFLLEWQKDHKTGTHGHQMSLRNYCHSSRNAV